MTAPTGDTIRAAIADGIADAFAVPHPERISTYDLADALTPTVRRLITQAVTTALNDAADELPTTSLRDPHELWLRNRAATYTTGATR